MIFYFDKNVLNFGDWLNKINEGLIKSYDIDFTINRLNIYLSSNKIKAIARKIYSFESKIEIEFLDLSYFSNSKDNIDTIISMLSNLYGYYPSMGSIETFTGTWDETKKMINPNTNRLLILFEAKYTKVENVPQFLYHLSIKHYLKSILRIGIKPKKGNKLTNSEDRIYLCKTIEDCKKLIPRMKKYYQLNMKDNHIIDSSMVILKIDTVNLNLNLYQDPNYDLGYFTNSNIPPLNLEIVFEENK